jgi:tRNA(fMet)-specific endonuclease VapC
MIYLLDTNAFSDLIREHPKVDQRLSSVDPTDQVLTSPIVRGELLFGIERMAPGRRRKEVEAKAAVLFGRILCDLMVPQVADTYALLKVQLERVGLPLEENDLWIAATAITLGAVLVTRDGDMARVPGLSVEDWTG